MTTVPSFFEYPAYDDARWVAPPRPEISIKSYEFIAVVRPRTKPSISAEASELRTVFVGLATKWRNETGGYALTHRRYTHPSYQAILKLGIDAIPLILDELQRRPDRWFEALKFLTKGNVNPAKEANTFDEAVASWIAWGKSEKFI